MKLSFILISLVLLHILPVPALRCAICLLDAKANEWEREPFTEHPKPFAICDSIFKQFRMD